MLKTEINKFECVIFSQERVEIILYHNITRLYPFLILNKNLMN